MAPTFVWVTTRGAEDDTPGAADENNAAAEDNTPAEDNAPAENNATDENNIVDENNAAAKENATAENNTTAKIWQECNNPENSMACFGVGAGNFTAMTWEDCAHLNITTDRITCFHQHVASQARHELSLLLAFVVVIIPILLVVLMFGTSINIMYTSILRFYKRKIEKEELVSKHEKLKTDWEALVGRCTAFMNEYDMTDEEYLRQMQQEQGGATDMKDPYLQQTEHDIRTLTDSTD